MFNLSSGKNRSKNRRPQAPYKPVKPGELMDPVLYVGGLDETKYPRLSQKEDDHLKSKEVENPLNKRSDI